MGLGYPFADDSSSEEEEEGVNVKVWLQLPWMDLIHSLFWPQAMQGAREDDQEGVLID